jgi:hypothetical protein
MNDTVRNENVIAALRLARAATDDYEKFGRVAERILNEAAATSDTNSGGVELLLSLHKAGELVFEVSAGA